VALLLLVLPGNYSLFSDLGFSRPVRWLFSISFDVDTYSGNYSFFSDLGFLRPDRWLFSISFDSDTAVLKPAYENTAVLKAPSETCLRRDLHTSSL
jgi:hypothetical protein